jgi:hypothetical protein
MAVHTVEMQDQQTAGAGEEVHVAGGKIPAMIGYYGFIE